MHIAAWVIAAALICGNIALGIQLLTAKHRIETGNSTGSDTVIEQTVPQQTTVTEEHGTDTASSAQTEPEQIGERLWRVTLLPAAAAVKTEPGSAGGTVRSGNSTASAFGREFDFSGVTDPDGTQAVYCIRADLSEVFWFSGGRLFRADAGLQSPEIVCATDRAVPTALYAIPGDKNLYFYGTADGSRCIGSFDTETGKTAYFKCGSVTPVLCSKGILFAHTGGISFDKQYKCYYYENGLLYKIPLGSAAEALYEPALSANGNYLCTCTQSASAEGKHFERWSVYDVRTGKLIRILKRTFDTAFTGSQRVGFLFVGFDEDAQSIYLEDKQSLTIYRYDFGG